MERERNSAVRAVVAAQGEKQQQRGTGAAACERPSVTFGSYSSRTGIHRISLMVFATASIGFHSTGYELNPILLNWAKLVAYRRGISREQAIFLQQDFWAADLSKYNNVTVFLAPGVVDTLKKKLADELPDNARVIVCRFPLIGWSPTCSEGTGLDQVWAYDMANVRRASLTRPDNSGTGEIGTRVIRVRVLTWHTCGSRVPPEDHTDRAGETALQLSAVPCFWCSQQRSVEPHIHHCNERERCWGEGMNAGFSTKSRGQRLTVALFLLRRYVHTEESAHCSSCARVRDALRTVLPEKRRHISVF
ncbi:unnamed protein product [Ranitomeya imitator]|uniref:Uncharacterized protein n=1 Tax=Ranitomeya imitator TaxID=111125 RepID=A0ABN9LVK4_9NEOB|nr:unnamed protein product [Ranitomeya imitator]